MNERIKELIVESGNGQMRDGRLYPHIGIRFEEDWQRFAEVLIRECVNTLEFHGFDDAVPYIKWMATNKLGVDNKSIS